MTDFYANAPVCAPSRSALITGAFAERMRFSAVLIFSALWLLLVYAPVCHWVWGGGWLAEIGALDFAGGTVVHINAGMTAVVAALVIGPRKDRGRQALLPHNVPMVLLGAALLAALLPWPTPRHREMRIGIKPRASTRSS